MTVTQTSTTGWWRDTFERRHGQHRGRLLRSVRITRRTFVRRVAADRRRMAALLFA